MHTYKDDQAKKEAIKARKQRKENREAKRNWN